MFVMRMKTLCKWLVMTEYELFINLLGLLVFSILLCLKLDASTTTTATSTITTATIDHISWLGVFTPLFVADMLQINFISIVFIRQLNEMLKREAMMRMIVSSLLLLARLIFKLLVFFLIIRNNSSINNNGSSASANANSHMATAPAVLKFQVCAMPLFFHLIVLLFRSCGLKSAPNFN